MEIIPNPPQDIEHTSGQLSSHVKPAKQAEALVKAQDDESTYPPFTKKILSMLCIFLSSFLIALDRTIIATAIPSITAEFNSLPSIGWYASAYLLTNCSSILVWGRIYTFAPAKWVYISCILLFEIGSAICGSAPNSLALIVGRAVAGLGSGGLFGGGIVIMVHCIPLRKRPLYIGLLGSVWGIASSVGPLLGGMLTTKASWRWCFYINLPVGGIAILIVAPFVHVRSPSQEGDRSVGFSQVLAKLDPLGTFCLLGGTVSMLLALQFGGTILLWGDQHITAVLVCVVVLIVAFVVVQMWKQDSVLLPPRIISQRRIAFSAWFVFCLGVLMTVLIYYLPIWFQVVQKVTALESGIRTLPLVLSLNISSVVAGALVRWTGHTTPFAIFGSCVTAIGAGLLTTFKFDSPSAIWIGFQIVYGIGLGFGLEQANITAQNVLSKKDVPIGASCMIFAMSLGGAIFASVGQNVFGAALKHEAIPLFSPENAGASGLRNDTLTLNEGQEILRGYNEAVVKVFQVALVMACTSILGSMGMWGKSRPWRRLGLKSAEADSMATSTFPIFDESLLESERK